MIKKLLATAAVAALFATPAVAGTLVDPVVEPAPVMPVYEPETDWSGFYAGVGGMFGIVGPNQDFGIGAQVGYLHDMGDVVLGGELSYNYVFTPAGHHVVGLDALLGYDAGMVMPFVTAGGTYVAPTNIWGWSLGAGLSVKATDNVILTGRYRYSNFGLPNDLHQIMVGVSYQF